MDPTLTGFLALPIIPANRRNVTNTFLTTASVLNLVTPPILLVASMVWVIRSGRTVPRLRRRIFVPGLFSATLAYAAHFLLAYFLRTAHLNNYDRVDTIVGVGGLMFLAALLGLIAGFFGRGYGRICACAASVIIGMLWWFTGMTTF